MKILVVNNHTEHLKNLAKELKGHDVEMQVYMPGIKFNDHDKDLVILSGGGGEGMEIDDFFGREKLWYQDEIEFVRQCDKPILGICMGFEIICKAFDERVKPMSYLLQGHKPVKVTEAGQEIIDKHVLMQFESHRYCVPHVSPEKFDVLARSDIGIEMIRHKHKPIFAVQFHPEKGGTIALHELLEVATKRQLIPA